MRRADVLAYDYFDYGTTTGMTLGGLGGATNGFSGAWVDTATIHPVETRPSTEVLMKHWSTSPRRR